MKTLLQTIGNTPLVKVQHLVDKPNVSLLLKLEGNNPGGSVKDRAAFNMINEALKNGDIQKGDTLIEATSGNTGIALALFANLLGVKVILVMPEDATAERVKTMKAYGAEVILTPTNEGIEGSRVYAEKQHVEKGYFMLNQFANDNNWKAHYLTTGPEIWKQTDGKITHFVSAMGTTGTIMGTSTFLKEQNSNIQIVGVQPKDGAKIPGIRKWEQAFLPKIFKPNKVDSIIEVTQQEAENTTKLLALKEGVFAGISAGGAVAKAIELANSIEEGLVVAIVPDRGDKYLSIDLFGTTST